MAATTVDLIDKYAIEQGATYRATLIWKTGTPLVPVVITSYSARAMFKTSPIFDVSSVVSITKANPGVVTTKAPHLLKTGQTIVFPNTGGMTELTSRYTVTALSATTFSIGVDTTTFTTYTGNGVIAFVSLTNVLGNDGQLILGTTGGDVQIYIKDTVTNQMSGGGSYDIEMVSPSNDVTRIAQGSFVVSPNVTR